MKIPTEKVKIFVQKVKTGYMVYANFTHYQPVRPDRETALEHFVKNLHLRNYEIVETEVPKINH